MSRLGRTIKAHALLLAFLLEMALLFFFRNDSGFIISPLLMTLAGLFLALYPFFILKSGSKTKTIGVTENRFQFNSNQVWFIQGILALFFVVLAGNLFRIYPVDINNSDIIPFIMEVLVKRFTQGENVYAVVSDFNHYATPFIPNYFPMHWLPFTLASLFHFDPRWVPVILFALSAGLHVRLNLKVKKISPARMIFLQLPWFIALSVAIKQGHDLANNIELMIMAYYLFLANTLFLKAPFIRSLGLTFPFLSRYSLLFWLPAYGYGLLKKNLKLFSLTALGFTLLVLGCFVIPFVIPNPGLLNQSGNIYLEGAVGEWSGQSWQAPGDKPFQLFQGMGFASWIYTFASGTLLEKVQLLKLILLVVSIFGAILPLVFYKVITRVLPSDWFSLLTLKFCLTLFYAFILVPYLYLFWVPLMVSAVILVKAENLRESQSEN